MLLLDYGCTKMSPITPSLACWYKPVSILDTDWWNGTRPEVFIFQSTNSTWTEILCLKLASNDRPWPKDSKSTSLELCKGMHIIWAINTLQARFLTRFQGSLGSTSPTEPCSTSHRWLLQTVHPEPQPQPQPVELPPTLSTSFLLSQQSWLYCCKRMWNKIICRYMLIIQKKYDTEKSKQNKTKF